MIRSAHRPPLSLQCPPVIKTTICFLKALLNVCLTRFVRKCTTISSPHGPEIWSWFKKEKGGGLGFFFVLKMHIQMRGLNCLSYWRIMLCECWDGPRSPSESWVFGQQGHELEVVLPPLALVHGPCSIPLLMRLWQHSKSGPCHHYPAHNMPRLPRHNNTF